MFDEDEGFTLIELLVVMIVIGILAAIAVPIYLSQRQSGYDAGAKSDMWNLARLEEQHLHDKDTYTTIAQIVADGEVVKPTKGVTLSVVRYTATGSYCLSAKSSSSPHTWYWDSASNGLQPLGATGCPVTTTGTSGDSVSG